MDGFETSQFNPITLRWCKGDQCLNYRCYLESMVLMEVEFFCLESKLKKNFHYIDQLKSREWID